MKYKKYFLFGLCIFYLVIFFAPSKIIYFSAFFIATFFFYLGSKNIKESLFYSLILSLFSDVSLARSLFLLEPKDLFSDSGYWISPTTILTLCLLPFSLRQKRITFKLPDVILFLFYSWTIFILIVFPSTNVLYGIFSLTEIVILYYIFRQYLSSKNLSIITSLIISMFIFQSSIGVLQLIFHRPIGLVSEVGIAENPYGVVSVEEKGLFRLSGTFWHPNSFAAFLLVVMPFLYLAPSNTLFYISSRIVLALLLFFTFSRTAWIIFIFISSLLFITKKIYFKIPYKKISKYYYILLLAGVLLFMQLSPYLSVRLNSFYNAFEEGGSFDVRLKLLREGINLIEQFPLTGVGLNNSLYTYATSPVTDLFKFSIPSAYSIIHNTFLLLAVEIGLPGLFLFLCFLLLVANSYFENRVTYFKNSAFFGLLGFIGISLFNPYLHDSQFRLVFLLAAIILA